MKRLLLVLAFVLFSTLMADAQNTLTLAPGEQKTASSEGARGAKPLKIKFLSVLEDSRCPEDVDCIWAGNAKVKIEVYSQRAGTKVFELNTNGGPKGNQLDGFAIEIVGIEPKLRSDRPVKNEDYRLTVKVSRLTR